HVLGRFVRPSRELGDVEQHELIEQRRRPPCELLGHALIDVVLRLGLHVSASYPSTRSGTRERSDSTTLPYISMPESTSRLSGACCTSHREDRSSRRT